MKAGGIWTIGGALVIIVGGLSFHLGSLEAAAEPPFSVTVPPARIGDEARYHAYHRNSSAMPWTAQADTPEILDAAPAWGFRIEETALATDRTGRSHETLRVLWGGHTKDARYGEDGLTGYNVTWGHQAFVDLGSRSVIQFDALMPWTYYVLDPSIPTSASDFSLSNYGPNFTRAGTFAYDFQALPHLVAHAGRTYALGDDVPTASTHLLDSQWVLQLQGATNLTTSTQAALRGTIEGDDAIGLRTKGCVDLALTRQERMVAQFWGADPEFEWPPRVPLFHAMVPAHSHVCFTVETWLVSSLAYPVHYEARVDVDGMRHTEWLEALAAFRPGGQLVEFPEPFISPGFADTNTDLERSPPGQRFPADGTGSKLRYPFSSALQAVLADPTLLGFQSWRAANPEHYIVGGELRIAKPSCAEPTTYYVDPDGTNNGWTLLFGAPSGRYFLLVSEDSAAGTINCELGQVVGRPFTVDELPRQPITIAAMEGAARHLVDNDPTPNRLEFGLRWRCKPVATTCATRDLSVTGPGSMTTAVVGSITYARTLGTTGYRDNAVVLGLDSGNLEGRYFWVEDVPLPSLVAPAAPLQPSAPRVVAPTSPPNNPTVLVVTAAASLLAFAAAMYLYPLLKFYLGQALAFFPGYAKLRRSELLSNHTREHLVELIRQDPGISPPELAKQVNAGWTTIVYHLKVLETNGFVSSLLDGRHKRYFPADSVDWSRRGRVAALRNAKTKAVLGLILSEPGIIRREIASRIGFSTTAAGWHLERLRACGLVAHDEDGRKIRYYAADSENPLPGPRPGPEVA